MADNIVTLTGSNGMLVSDAGSVPVSSGDTLTIRTDDGSPFALFFSPDAAKVLSPAPETPFEVPKGSHAAFTFTSSKPGAYTVFYGAPESAQPGSYPPELAQVLYISMIAGTIVGGFGGPGGNETMTTGR